MLNLLSLSLTYSLAVVSATVKPCGASPPHIMFIVVDDLGWNDVGFQNNAIPTQRNVMQTPHIDTLATSGVVLDDYTVYKYCSPSRSQMLVGRYAYHLGQQSMNLGPTGSGCALPLANKMLPAMLKEAPVPYRTAMLGKYHQGFYRPQYTPTRRGFDTFFGFYDGGESHYTHITPFAVWRQPGIPYWWTPADNASHPTQGCGALVDLSNNTVEQLRSAPPALNGSFSTDVLGSEAVRVIESHSDPEIPFFMYMAFHCVHTPLEAPDHYTAPYKSLVNDTDRRLLGGMVSAVDLAVGNIVAALERKSMWNNTLLVFTTDNGGPVCLSPSPDVQRGEKIRKSCGTNNFPLRGSKMTNWQGGVRGVAFVSGPVLPAVMRGKRYDGMIHQVDWYPTLLKLAGVSDAVLNRSGTVPIDGVDQRDALFAGGHSRRTTLVHNINGDRPGAIRMGKYKFFKGYPGAKGQYNAFDGWWAPPEMGGAVEHPVDGQLCETSNCLFDLSVDPGERTDVSAAHPDVVEKMLALYTELQRSEITQEEAGLCNTSSKIPDGCIANRAKGVWEPWMPDDL